MNEATLTDTLDILTGDKFLSLIPPEVVATILKQRGGISLLQQRIGVLISLGGIQNALTSGDITSLQECLESFTKGDPDVVLQEQIYAMALECVRNVFQRLQKETGIRTDLAKCLNKALSIFPRRTTHNSLPGLNVICYDIVCFCVENIFYMRKKQSSDLAFYNILYYIVYHCVIAVDQTTAESMNVSMNKKHLYIKGKEITHFSDWLIEIGFDEHQCHDMHLAIYRQGTMMNDKHIQNSHKRERRRQERIRNKNRTKIVEDDDEGLRF